MDDVENWRSILLCVDVKYGCQPLYGECTDTTPKFYYIIYK